MPAAIAAAMLLLIAFCAVIDPACALFCKTQQENALATAKEACMQPAFALAQKNSETPGRDAAENIVASLRESGFDGKVEVHYYEAPAELTGPAKRLFAVGVQVSEDYETIVSRGVGIETLPVASHTVFSAVPYSEERAWRPERTYSGTYTQAAPNASLAWTEKTGIEDFPDEMAAEAASQLEKIK